MFLTLWVNRNIISNEICFLFFSFQGILYTQRDFSGLYSEIRRDSVRIKGPKEIIVIGTSAILVYTCLYLHIHITEKDQRICTLPTYQKVEFIQ